MTTARSVLLCMLLATCAAGAQASAEAADPRTARLEQALSFIEARAYNLPRLDWPATREAAQAALRATPGEAGLTAAIRGVLRALDDGHSFYRPPSNAMAAMPAAAPAASTPVPAPASPHAPIAVLASGGHVPVVQVNRWSGAPSQMQDAARQVRAVLVEAMAAAPCGLVLDLRGNVGGNVWPMFAGLAPLFAPGVLQTWVDRAGDGRAVELADGALRHGGRPMPIDVASLPMPSARPQRIALLLGARTASSGELLALGFAGDPAVRRFGAPTAGATTSNASLPLPGGAVLAVMSSHVRDRTGAMVSGPLQPDEATARPMEAAQAWLRTQCAASTVAR